MTARYTSAERCLRWTVLEFVGNRSLLAMHLADSDADLADLIPWEKLLGLGGAR